MASISAGILCDFAQVREGLLFVSSGGITRVDGDVGTSLTMYVVDKPPHGRVALPSQPPSDS